jgi:hypothetical protein
MICALLAGLPVYIDNRASRWVIYYFSGIVNCTPGLLYACTYLPCSAMVADQKGVVRSSESRPRNEVSSWPLSTLLLVSTIKIIRYHADIKSPSTHGCLVCIPLRILDIADVQSSCSSRPNSHTSIKAISQRR